ncbi:MAG: glycosyltransferase family 4 protein [Prevotella sp.]|nr:glycosyltransferase family 4 protein [Prevotella sp.]
MEKIKVLFVTHTTSMSGANQSMLKLIMELRTYYNVEPVVLMPLSANKKQRRHLLQACQEQHIESFSTRYYWFKNQRRPANFIRCLSNLLWYPLIYHKLHGQQFDLIHSNGSVISLGAFLSRVMKIPHVWHLREFGSKDYGLESLFGKTYEKWVYGKGDAFIAISEAIRRHFQTVILDSKIRMIYNGITPPEYHLQPERRNEDITRFCLVGLLTKAKNQLEALQAADILVKERGITQFHVSFIGYKEPQYTQILKAFVSERGLEPYVSFLGERNDVGTLLSGMDVGLMLSRNEAFGRVTVEYMMYGCAVIASNSGANQEIVEEDVTGYTYTLGDAHSLALKMERLIMDKTRLREFGKHGRERATKLFTSRQNSEQISNLYQSLIKH